MYKTLFDSWTIFFVMVFGLFLLMVSARPELQPRPGHEDAPGEKIELIGQILTWTTGSVLAYRMVRGTREQVRSNRSNPGA
jgi:hypothetical protein